METAFDRILEPCCALNSVERTKCFRQGNAINHRHKITNQLWANETARPPAHENYGSPGTLVKEENRSEEWRPSILCGDYFPERESISPLFLFSTVHNPSEHAAMRGARRKISSNEIREDPSDVTLRKCSKRFTFVNFGIRLLS